MNKLNTHTKTNTIQQQKLNKITKKIKNKQIHNANKNNTTIKKKHNKTRKKQQKEQLKRKQQSINENTPTNTPTKRTKLIPNENQNSQQK